MDWFGTSHSFLIETILEWIYDHDYDNVHDGDSVHNNDFIIHDGGNDYDVEYCVGKGDDGVSKGLQCDMVHVHDIKTNDAGDDAKRLFAVGGHMTTTTLN